MGMAWVIPSKFGAELTQGWFAKYFDLHAEERLRQPSSRITRRFDGLSVMALAASALSQLLREG